MKLFTSGFSLDKQPTPCYNRAKGEKMGAYAYMLRSPRHARIAIVETRFGLNTVYAGASAYLFRIGWGPMEIPARYRGAVNQMVKVWDETPKPYFLVATKDDYKITEGQTAFVLKRQVWDVIYNDESPSVIPVGKIVSILPFRSPIAEEIIREFQHEELANRIASERGCPN